jgi:hypothetical protein
VLTTRSIHRTTVVAIACLALLAIAGPAAAQQDLRSPDAVAAAATPEQDLRSPDTAALSDAPTRPAVHVSATGGGVDWTTIALGLAGGLLALGGIVAITVHSRRVGRVRISA